MLKNFQQLFFLISGMAIFIVLSGQPSKNNVAPDRPVPVLLSKRMDSLRKADDLAEWLYTYSEYVDTNPRKTHHFT